MSDSIYLHWFRNDLRLRDNPALLEATQAGRVVPIFIFDEDLRSDGRTMGAASRVWLHHSLSSLQEDLKGALYCFRGDAFEIIKRVVKSNKVAGISWNRCYEPWQIERDTEIKSWCGDNGVNVISRNGSLLWEPWEVLKKDGSPYRVFTHFFKHGCMNTIPPRKPLARVNHIKIGELVNLTSFSVDQLGLLPNHCWADNVIRTWQVGEKRALKRLGEFVKSALMSYKNEREFPASNGTSKLSAHLHFGELSPNQVWYTVRASGLDDGLTYLRQLAWREFSYNMMFYNPQMRVKNLRKEFDLFPWGKDSALLRAWQMGKTGVPIIDAGMRELWYTGSMHNRVRMLVGSFLVKNLRIHWHHGERWFSETLLDADSAINSASWQWVAGTGVDAAPYFRVFNPTLQSEKFDSEGEYISKYVPELGRLPNKYITKPWSAPESVLKKAKVTLGIDYPKPIVDIKESRAMALEAYKSMKMVTA